MSKGGEGEGELNLVIQLDAILFFKSLLCLSVTDNILFRPYKSFLFDNLIVTS